LPAAAYTLYRAVGYVTCARTFRYSSVDFVDLPLRGSTYLYYRLPFTAFSVTRSFLAACVGLDYRCCYFVYSCSTSTVVTVHLLDSADFSVIPRLPLRSGCTLCTVPVRCPFRSLRFTVYRLRFTAHYRSTFVGFSPDKTATPTLPPPARHAPTTLLTLPAARMPPRLRGLPCDKRLPLQFSTTTAAHTLPPFVLLPVHSDFDPITHALRIYTRALLRTVRYTAQHILYVVYRSAFPVPHRLLCT